MSLIGYGAKVEINDGVASAFAVVNNLTDIDPPDETWKTVESKRLDLASQTLVKVTTLKDPGEFSFSCEMDKTGWDRLTGLKNTQKNFKITILGASTPTDDIVRTVPGKITMVKPDQVEADKIVTFKVTVAINGPAS
jgi:hypothetical protein